MPITPLPQFEEDLAEFEAAEQDRLAYERLNAPKTIVIRHGVMKLVSELPYNGEAKPGCGSKLVARTSRGTEVGEMLTSTCPNAGCSKSVTRKEMLEYIENSGGRQYPFGTTGKILRVATKEDLDQQAAIEADRSSVRSAVARIAEQHRLDGKIVEVERILGGEHATVYIASEHRVEARAFAEEVERLLGTRVSLRGIGARDEARITADYERCGQHCCCKTFLKVLKPVSMRSAKQQKATLEPLKISGRCGRLMCCLRYEDQTYQDLKKNLPNRKKRVGSPEGDGIVVDSQILTQLVLIELDGPARKRVAIPVEDLAEPEHKVAPEFPPPATPSMRSGRNRDQASGQDRGRSRSGGSRTNAPADSRDGSQPTAERRGGPSASSAGDSQRTGDAPAKKTRRRRRRKGGAGSGGGTGQSINQATDQTKNEATGKPSGPDSPGADGEGGPANTPTSAGSGPPKKKRRRRRRRGKSPGAGEGGGNTPGGDTPAPPQDG